MARRSHQENRNLHRLSPVHLILLISPTVQLNKNHRIGERGHYLDSSVPRELDCDTTSGRDDAMGHPARLHSHTLTKQIKPSLWNNIDVKLAYSKHIDPRNLSTGGELNIGLSRKF